MASKNVKSLPIPIILEAIKGDGQALAAVLNHYKDYIRCLSVRKLKDDYGNEYFFVDENMRQRLEAKLICSIVSDFKILPA